MRFEVKDNYIPGAEKYFHKTTEIGWIFKCDYARLKDILEALLSSTKQQGIDFWSKDPAQRNKLYLDKAEWGYLRTR